MAKSEIEMFASGSLRLITPVKKYNLECKKLKPTPLSLLSTPCSETKKKLYIKLNLIIRLQLGNKVALYQKFVNQV